ncbi:MAG: DUF749 family protein [Methanomassiliicoccales archaeon]|nr:MAG: DUF749 family protein [Methanomassiliicoccales archaeon]
MHKAHLVGVYNHAELPEELQGFVRFQAHREKYDPKNEDKVAVLQIVGTTSYYPIFIDKIESLAPVEKGLKEIDAELDEVSRVSLDRVLQEKHK